MYTKVFQAFNFEITIKVWKLFHKITYSISGYYIAFRACNDYCSCILRIYYCDIFQLHNQRLHCIRYILPYGMFRHRGNLRFCHNLHTFADHYIPGRYYNRTIPRNLDKCFCDKLRHCDSLRFSRIPHIFRLGTLRHSRCRLKTYLRIWVKTLWMFFCQILFSLFWTLFGDFQLSTQSYFEQQKCCAFPKNFLWLKNQSKLIVIEP